MLWRSIGYGALLGALTAAPLDAADAWVEIRSPHFVVATDASDKDARTVAQQFEQIRGLLHSAMRLPKVDPPQPIVIIATQNEQVVKLLLPEDFATKSHTQHVGMYVHERDKDYVLVRINVPGSNVTPYPYRVVYHEYTHALMRLNFDTLPLWLEEGIAEFYGNSRMGQKQSKTGEVDARQLSVLQRNSFIPIETLLQVDHTSPFYNEKDQTSMFYAESWALFHYLMMSPDARRKELFNRFLTEYSKSGNQVDAATAAFGDLKTFGRVIEDYARQRTFYVETVTMRQDAELEHYTTRSLSPGETLALQGDFLSHRNLADAARPLLERAIASEPALPFAHEALGYCHYRLQAFGAAEQEMREALRLGSTDFSALYFHGLLLMRDGTESEGQRREAIVSLERAVKANPQYAPAHAELALAYARTAGMQDAAIGAALRAMKLAPFVLAYALNAGYVLANAGRTDEATLVANRLVAIAETPADKGRANALLVRIRQRGGQNQRPGSASSVGSPANPRIQELDEAIRRNPEDARAFNSRGVAYARSGDQDRAIKDYDEAIRLDPNYSGALLNRSNAHRRRKEHDLAIRDASEAIRLDPTSASAWNNRCYTRAVAGQFPEALADCHESLRLRPAYASALDSRAFTYLRLGQLKDAVSDYDAALQLDPKLAAALYGRGIAKRLAGDTAGGDRDIVAAKAVQPNIAEQMADLGITP
jgi:tetratricopeptide (TPR) repeat protein